MADGEVKRHHLVSRVLLKQWQGSQPNSRAVSCYNISSNKVRSVALRNISCKYEKLHPRDSHGFENLWQKTESGAASVLARINSGSIPQNNTWEQTIKDLMAIHLIRSIAYVRNHQMRFYSAIDNLDLTNVPDDILETVFMDTQYRVISSASAQRELAHQNYRNYLKSQVGTGPYHPNAMKCIYPFFRNAIKDKRCTLRRIPEALKDSTFLIGDCPVLPLTISKGQPTIAAQLFGPEIHTYMFPIGRKVTVQLSNVRSEQEARPYEVELLNELQIRNAKYEIVWDVKSDHHLTTVQRVLTY